MKKLFLFIFFCYSVIIQAQTTPLDYNGKLCVVGTHLCNQDSVPIQLRGISSAGIQWRWNCMKKESITVLRNEWGCDILRVAMYVTESGYNTDTAKFIARVDSMVQVCCDLGMYCVIDWHVTTPGDPNDIEYSKSNSFFSYMAQKHGAKPNVLFEICNEPNGPTTWTMVKNYALPIIDTIRKYSENIIIVGTPTWCQDLAKVAASPIDGYNNIMYTFHFYANTHASLKSSFKTNVVKIPVFVSEFGTGSADGKGVVNIKESDDWMNILAENKVSWCNWSYSEKDETVSALLPNSCVDKKWNNTSISGQYMKSKMRTPDMWIPIGSRPYFVQACTDTLGAKIFVSVSSQLQDVSTIQVSDFQIRYNDSIVDINSVQLDIDKSIIVLSVARNSSLYDNITVSYIGTSIVDVKDSLLMNFELKQVENKVRNVIVQSYSDNFSDNTNTTWFNNVQNDFTFQESNQELQITANYTNPTNELRDPFVFDMPTLVDMSKQKTISIMVKTSDLFELRVEVQDNQGNISNANPIVKTISADGSYQTYTFDFIGKFSQSNPTASVVDSTQIDKILFYTNPNSSFNGLFSFEDMTIGSTPIFVSKVTVVPTSLTLRVGETYRFNCTIEPLNATNKNLMWSVDDTLVAKITQKGEVIPMYPGTTIVKIVSYDNPLISTFSTIKVSGDTVNRTVLRASIVQAQILMQNAVIGNAIGQYQKAVVDTFQLEIQKAQYFINYYGATLANITAANKILQNKIVVFTNSKNGDNLLSAIQKATHVLDSIKLINQELYTNLSNEIAKATLIVQNANVTIEELENATHNLDNYVLGITNPNTALLSNVSDDLNVNISKSYIVIASKNIAIAYVQLLTINGEIVLKQQIQSNVCNLSMKGIAQGSYILVIQLENNEIKMLQVIK